MAERPPTRASRRALLLVVLPLLAAAALALDDDLRERLRALTAARDYQGVLDITDRVIAEDGDSVPAWQYRAYALHQLGQVDRAREAYERALVLDPGSWWAHMNLGQLHADQRRWGEAVAALERAAELSPRSTEIRARLSRVHRERGDYDAAVTAAERAAVAGVDRAWCHAELGYLLWVRGDLAESREHWRKARELGGNDAACEHGLRLVEWDRPTGSEREREEVARRRAGGGEPWSFRVGGVTVSTRVGPKLPREIRKLLADLQDDFGRLFGIREDWEGSIRLELSRTVEEHEVHRLREFPQGYSGKAFFTQRRDRPRGGWRRGGPGAGPGGWNVTIYVAWSEPGLEAGLSHEIAHGLLRIRTPRGRYMPAWLDEGVATYLELAPPERGRPASGTVRKDLLVTLAEARAAGRALSLRELLVAPPAEFTGPHARARYAQAWSLVHYLLEEHDRSGERRLRRYLDAIDSPGPAGPEEVFGKIYGDDLAGMEEAWAKYVAGLGD